MISFNYYLFQLFVNRRKLKFINVAFCSLIVIIHDALAVTVVMVARIFHLYL